MEERQHQRKNMTTVSIGGRISKKKRPKELFNLQSHTLFPLLLAAKSRNRNALIKKCLNQIILSLPRFLSASVLSLVPPLLKSNSAEVVCKTAEIVGLASLSSFEMNERIALDDEIIKNLISLLGSSMRKLSMVACNTMLDLATASVGRQRLLQFSAIEKLFLGSIQVFKPSAAVVSVYADVILFKDDEYSASLFHVAIILINSCTMEQQRDIPTELSESYLVHLKRLWGIINKQRFCVSSLRSGCESCEKDFYTSNIRTNELAESIFRLSITSQSYPQPVACNFITESTFGLGQTTFELFLSNAWEVSPMLMGNRSQVSASEDGIFRPFIQFLGPKEAIPSFLLSILNRFVSCPPTASDEVDILQVIENVRDQLGCPLVYNQDFRVLKTPSGKEELHYFQELSGFTTSVDRHVLNINDILKIEEAFGKGYSIALRGMEFRFQAIASIADGLASLFGQPSAGVNMYFTPMNSQGLARHSDDHCVFVCQLLGVKRWRIFPRPRHQLPRLYEPLDIPQDLQADSKIADEYQQYLLKEGDVLYIPRGCPHEAQTITEDVEKFNNPSGFSLHLTLAIEIEPPFEWEGFMHIAVHTWYEKNKTLQYMPPESQPQNLHIVPMKLLHVAINLVGEVDRLFRKACLVGAPSFSFINEDSFNNNPRTVFGFFVTRISTESKFLDILKHIKAALNKNEDPLGRLQWMKHLVVDEEIENWNNILSFSSAESRFLMELSSQHRVVAEEFFMQVMMKFCKEVEFNDVELKYKMLLEKYREVRKQYTNGMLSLHCNINEENGSI